MRATLRHLAAAFQFLTRLPVPGTPQGGAELGRALAWFPLPGLAVGALSAGLAWALRPYVAAGVLAVLVVASLAALTGGLHLDGLADVADGLGGGHGDRTRTLAIMRDSRIGAFGAVALVLALFLKVAAVRELLARGPAAWALLSAPTLARLVAVPLVVMFPYARPEGLGRPFHDGGGTRELAIAIALTALVLPWFGARVLLPSAAAIAAATVLALWARRRLGGLTGDVYGAAIELAEVAFLVGASAG